MSRSLPVSASNPNSHKDSNDIASRYRLKYNSSTDTFYTFKTTTKDVDVKFGGQDDFRHFVLEEYDKIFSQFNKLTDSVSAEIRGPNTILILQRKLFDDQNKESTEAHSIPAGVYRFVFFNGVPHLQKITSLNMDDYVDLNNPVKNIQQDIDFFCEKKDTYKNLGMRYRRSALIYGPPGNGKTLHIVKTLLEKTKANNDIAIILDGSIRDLDFMLAFRDALADKKVYFVIEEITERLNDNVETFLSFLDGEYSWDNCYVIGTTNYPDKLPENIVDRPGRFDTIIEVDDPDEKARKLYLSKFYPDISDETIKLCKGFSVAYLKELVLQSQLHGVPLGEVVSKLKKHKEMVKKNFSKRSAAGFGFNDDYR